MATVVIDGIRYREEDAKARGLLGERKVEDKPEVPAKATAPANKGRKPASK